MIFHYYDDSITIEYDQNINSEKALIDEIRAFAEEYAISTEEDHDRVCFNFDRMNLLKWIRHNNKWRENKNWRIIKESFFQRFNDRISQYTQENHLSLPLPFSFSAQNWTRIWFTKNPDICITPDNKNKIKAFLTEYPDYKMTLIYDSALLNDNGQIDLQRTINELQQHFPNRITFSNFRSDEFKSLLKNDIEKSLYRLAEDELDHLNSGGSVAAASDIVRTIRPAYSTGIYTDFDVEFTETIYDSFQAASPLVFSRSHYRKVNDIMAIHPDMTKHTDGALETCQKQIISNYLRFNNEASLSDFVSLYIPQSAREAFINGGREDYPRAISREYEQTDPKIPPLRRYRYALETLYNTTEVPHFKNLCEEEYKDLVIRVSGPAILPEDAKHSHMISSGLSKIVKGQVDGVSGASSWTLSNQQHSKAQLSALVKRSIVRGKRSAQEAVEPTCAGCAIC